METEHGSLVTRASRFALRAHGTQTRHYTGEPYWKHCAEVAGWVATVEGHTPEMLAAAWLHDVVEDTDATHVEVYRLFGASVARLVAQLTDVSQTADGNRAARKAKDRRHLSEGSAEAQTIKLADLISNTASILTHDVRFAAVYLQEMRDLLAVLTRSDDTLHAMATQMLLKGERSLLNPVDLGVG